jgi:hypothetical protein
MTSILYKTENRKERIKKAERKYPGRKRVGL